MLQSIKNSAHALAYRAETLGEDPETVVLDFMDCNSVEINAVVEQAHAYGLSRRSEWGGDFLNAHWWNWTHKGN